MKIRHNDRFPISRAKRLDNNRWVYGYYFEVSGYHCIIETDNVIETTASLEDVIKKKLKNGNIFEVDGNTVCNSVGTCDKNGFEIFLGDIVVTDEGNWRAYVEFSKGNFFCKDTSGGFSTFCNWENFVVIGNIYDNKGFI